MSKKILSLLMISVISIQAALDNIMLDKVKGQEFCSVLIENVYSDDEQAIITKQIQTTLPSFPIGDNYGAIGRNLKQKIVNCYAYSQLFTNGNASNDQELFAILLYSALTTYKEQDVALMMRWLNSTTLWYSPDALEVFASLTSKEQAKNNQMFGKIIKTLTHLYRHKRLMHDIIAVIIRQSFGWLTSQYLDSDILEPPESITNLYIYITYCVLSDQSIQSLLQYSDSEVGISIDYSRNSINRVKRITHAVQLEAMRQNRDSQGMQLCVEICAHISMQLRSNFIELDILNMGSPSNPMTVKAFLLLVYMRSSLTHANFDKEIFRPEIS